MRLLGYSEWLLGCCYAVVRYSGWLLRCCSVVARVLWVVARLLLCSCKGTRGGC